MFSESGCAGLGSRMVYANSKLNFEFALLAGEGAFRGENREKQWNCLGFSFRHSAAGAGLL